MKFRLSLCSAALLLLSSVGCCHMSTCCTDPCAPPLAGCGLTGWVHGEIDAWRSRNHYRNAGWNGSDCGCSSCGGQLASYDGGSCAGGNCGSPVAPGGGCSGCSGGSNYAPGSVPTPVPADTAPAPAPPVPASDAAARMMMMQGRQVVMLPQPAVPGQPVQVSWEEFQKLPGTVVSGPGAAVAGQAAPAAAPLAISVPQQSTVPPQTFAAPAVAAPTSIVPAAASVLPQNVVNAPAPGTSVPTARPVQQAAWTPLKQ